MAKDLLPEKWDGRVFGFGQNTPIELKPGEIAVDQQTLFISHQSLGVIAGYSSLGAFSTTGMAAP